MTQRWLPRAPEAPGAAGPPATAASLPSKHRDLFSYCHHFATKMIQNFSLFFQWRLLPPRNQNLFLTLRCSLLSVAPPKETGTVFLLEKVSVTHTRSPSEGGYLQTGGFLSDSKLSQKLVPHPCNPCRGHRE